MSVLITPGGAGAAVEDLVAFAARAMDIDLSTAASLACVAFALAAVVLATYAEYIRRRPAAALHPQTAVTGAAPPRNIPERAATSAAPTISSSSSCSPSPSSDTFDDASESVSSEHEETSSPSPSPWATAKEQCGEAAKILIR